MGKTGAFLAQDLLTSNNNAWDDVASGTNVNIASHSTPNPYTLAQLYAALTATYPSITDEASFINYVTNNPEVPVGQTARDLLFAGYAVS